MSVGVLFASKAVVYCNHISWLIVVQTVVKVAQKLDLMYMIQRSTRVKIYNKM